GGRQRPGRVVALPVVVPANRIVQRRYVHLIEAAQHPEGTRDEKARHHHPVKAGLLRRQRAQEAKPKTGGGRGHIRRWQRPRYRWWCWP
nr:hypothetical protein [Tanacetum cinerariifolium]